MLISHIANSLEPMRGQTLEKAKNGCPSMFLQLALDGTPFKYKAILRRAPLQKVRRQKVTLPR